ncbi:MAG: SDR family NAD(P)-dependent oxidoreductase [Spirochaetota bacterium]
MPLIQKTGKGKCNTQNFIHKEINIKTVVITGGNRGLGKALVETFYQAGWYVIFTARDTSQLTQRENSSIANLDLADYSSIQNFAEEVQSLNRTIDLIIHNAGYNPKDSSDKDYFQSTLVAHFSGNNIAKFLRIPGRSLEKFFLV